MSLKGSYVSKMPEQRSGLTGDGGNPLHSLSLGQKWRSRPRWTP